MLLRLLTIRANVTFDLTGNHGAALVTKYMTYPEDADYSDHVLAAYTKKHYNSWVEFAFNRGASVNPVLVSGVDMTKDYTMTAYSYEDASIGFRWTVDSPKTTYVPAASFGVTWRAERQPYMKSGPLDPTPPPSVQTIDIPPPERERASDVPDQCVFIRYYTMRSRGPFGWRSPEIIRVGGEPLNLGAGYDNIMGSGDPPHQSPKVIRTGAEPHDTGPGNNTEGPFQELAVQSDAEPTMSNHEDYGGLWAPTTGNTDLQPDVVVRNTPYV